MKNLRFLVFLAAAAVFAAVCASDACEARFYDNPVDCYALLVVAANDTNSTIKRNLDPIDVNGSLVALARVYGALIEAGFDDANIIVLYCSGGLQPDWSEKKEAKYIKMVKKHFNRQGMDANKANINSAVASVKSKLDGNDQFVFWINTHGAANGNLMMAPRGMWSTGEIQETFTGLKSKTNIIMFDSCFSGQILNRCNMPNAVMFSTTQANSPGWVDRTFTNCANFLEYKIDKKLDKNKDGVTDCDEAFAATMKAAKEYDPKLKDYMRNKYKPAKPAPPGTMERSSIIPMIKVGDSYERCNLGPSKSGEKVAKVKKTAAKRKKDPGVALIKKAKLYESGKDYVTAIDIYKKIVDMGANTKCSNEAKQKMDKLLSKPKIKKEFDEANLEKQLEEDYAMAESFMLASRYEDVIEYCEKILKAAPNTVHAQRAKILLDGAKEAQKLQKEAKQ